VEKGDMLTFVGGFLIVLVIAVIANPQYLALVKGAGEKATPVPIPVPTVSYPIQVTPTYFKPTSAPLSGDAPPYQIFYSDKPFLYPVYKLPENMETFGASDIVSRKQEMVPFAFVDEKRGGLTQKFSVPYPVW
jgi:hypothetical protein